MISFKRFLEESNHPFRFAYPADNNAERLAAEQVYHWVEQKFGFSHDLPELWVVGHMHMQDAARSVEHFNSINGVVYGWFSDKFPDKVFISDRIKLARNQSSRAVLAHEFTHYLQYHSGRYLNSGASIQDLEAEADKMLSDYML